MNTYPSYPSPPPAPEAPLPAGGPTVPNRLLGVGDLVSGSFRTIKAAPRIFLGLPLMVALGVGLPAVVLFAAALAAGLATDNASSMLAVIICTGIVVGLAAIYLVLRLTGALTTAAYRIALGERPSLAAAWQEGRLVVWPLVGLAGLLVVAYFAAIVAFIAIIGGIAVVGDSAGGAIAVVLMMFCAIPAMYWLMVKLVFVYSAIAIERVGPVTAIRRSFRLTRGMWWVTLGRLLMLVLLAMPVIFLFNMLSLPFQTAFESESAGANVALGIGGAVAGLLSVVLNFVFQVYSYVYITLMYLDARRRESMPTPGIGTPVDAASYPYGAPGTSAAPYGGGNSYPPPAPESVIRPYPGS